MATLEGLASSINLTGQDPAELTRALSRLAAEIVRHRRGGQGEPGAVRCRLHSQRWPGNVSKQDRRLTGHGVQVSRH
ncbi:MAG: hypothetical protein DLM67_14955 [Candidatus Nephthysia bennettiae]|nr:MAG: hypothetical protein DLM67_14955 [Candidatus Dormibacteraeota bacterium]